MVTCNHCNEILSKRQLQKKQTFCNRKCFGEYRQRKNICPCGGITQNDKYCSVSCSNRYRAVNPTKDWKCIICLKPVGKKSTFCGNTCLAHYNREIKIYIWLTTGKGAATSTTGEIRSWLVDWLKELVDYTCQECGWRKFHPIDNRPGVQIDHINGNNKDHRPENLRALCPECHWRTETYCGRNKVKLGDEALK